MVKKITEIIFIIVIGGISSLSAQSTATKVEIGFITDFPLGDQSRSFISQITKQIDQTTGTSISVQSSSKNIVSIAQQQENPSAYYERLSENVDLIVVIGPWSMNKIVKQKAFNVPTIGLGVFDLSAQNIPHTKRGTSGVQNFSYALTSISFKKELNEFKKLYNFENLALLLSNNTQNASEEKRMEDIMDSLNTDYQLISMQQGVDSAMDNMEEETDAVFIGIPFGLTSAQTESLSEQLIKKKLPSFSLLSQHVKQGVLSSYSDANSREKIMRKVAVLSDMALNGNDLADAKVAVNYNKKLFLNMNTAERIDYSPPFNVLFTAEQIGDKTMSSAKKWSLEKVVSKSLKQNLNVQLSEKEINLSRNDLRFARSQYLPQLNASATGVQIDQDRAKGSLGAQAQRTLTASGTLEQLLYSEQAIANIKIQKYLLNAQNAKLNQQVNDILLDTFTSYFNVLKTKTNADIQRENLESSKKNLEFAKVRVEIGQSSKSDLYRWESEVATARQAVINAKIRHQQSKLKLSKLLNEELGDDFELEEQSLQDRIFPNYAEGSLGKIIRNPRQLQQFTQFLIQEADSLNPAFNRLNAQEDVTNRQHKLNKRRFFSPTLALQGQLDNSLWEGGAGTGAVNAGGQSSLPMTDDWTWNLALNISLPIIDQGQRIIDLQRTNIQKRQIDIQQRNLNQNVELGIRSQVLDLLSASTNVKNSRIAAENTQKNYEAVQDGYQKGVVPINQLIDAQDAAFSSRQNFENSVYNYLMSFLQLENKLGRYSILSNDKEKQAFFNRYLRFTENNQTQ